MDQDDEQDKTLEPEEIETALELKKAIMPDPGPERAIIFYHFAKGEKTKNEELAALAGCRKPTVSKAFKTFEEMLLIDEDREELTEIGEIVADLVIPFIEKGYAVQHLSPFIRQLRHGSNEALFDNLDLFRSADILEEGRRDQERPLREYRALIQSADEIREIVPFRTPVSDDFTRQVVHGDLDCEFVVAADVMDEALEEDDTRETLENMRDSGAKYFVYDKNNFPEFMLTIADDDIVGLLASDSEYVFVQNSDESVLEWADDVYNQLSDDTIKLETYR